VIGNMIWDGQALAAATGERQYLSQFNEVSTRANGLGTESLRPHIG